MIECFFASACSFTDTFFPSTFEILVLGIEIHNFELQIYRHEASENFNRPLYEILETDYGVVALTSKEEISAAAADAFIASKLEIKQGEPILIRKRYVYDIHNNPIEFNVGCYRADSFTYTIESKRNI